LREDGEGLKLSALGAVEDEAQQVSAPEVDFSVLVEQLRFGLGWVG
jgi:hypothetical protein